MTSAIPVQRSNQLSYQANWEVVNCEFVIYPWMKKTGSEYMKFIYLNCGITFYTNNRSSQLCIQLKVPMKWPFRMKKTLFSFL